MRFSVIIPLYNKAPYVAKAIGSVLAQTFTDFDLIIIDDGSKDESYAVALKAIEGHGNCHIYKQKNAGVSMARNIGVALSRGDYLCFLDADDWWDPNFLMEMSRLIEELPDAGIYGTNYTIVNETKHKTRVAEIGVEEGFERGYVNYCQTYAKTMYMPLTSISVAIPRFVFDEMKGFPKGIKLGEDFLLWIHIALRYKVAFLNKPLAFYNQDVEVENRARHHLHPPKNHMLWHLDDLQVFERENMDYKVLVDRLRVFSLQYYLLDKRYEKEARAELAKVEWKQQSRRAFLLCHSPFWALKIREKIYKMLSAIKNVFS